VKKPAFWQIGQHKTCYLIVIFMAIFSLDFQYSAASICNVYTYYLYYRQALRSFNNEHHVSDNF